ncbi:MAG TPA: fibrinogen-like YCDxxxxGGGW domain-containing protein [Nannocystis sp.]|jgi:cysteine-rich repeat protein
MHRSLALALLCLAGCPGEVIEGTGAPATTATTTGTTDTPDPSTTDTPTTSPNDPSTSTGPMTASTTGTTGTAPTSTGPDTTTGAPCGNGVPDPGEQCDDGNELQGDDCTNACTRAASCLELLGLDATLPDGEYTIDPDGDGTAVMVYCDMAGGGWTRVVDEDLDTPMGWAGGASSQCGGIGSLLGGAGQLGAGATLSKGFALLGVPHTQLRASAAVAIIDTWDSETINLEVDAEIVASKLCVYVDTASCNQVDQQCGEPTAGDGEIVLAGELMHATDAALVKLSTTLNEAASNEAWGLNSLQVYVR